MLREKIIVFNHKKEKLVGHFYKGTSKTIIIVCHGIASINTTSDSELQVIIPDYFSKLREKTHASIFSFDFSGFGESDGELSYSLKKRDAEIKAVIDYFSGKYKNIILYGSSFAGISIVIAAIKYKKITGLITVNGFFTYNPSKIYLFNVFVFYFFIVTHPYSWSDLLFMRKNERAEKITIPTLVVYSDKDSYVMPKQSLSFFSRLRTRKKIIPLASNDHGMKDVYLQISPQIAEWLEQEKLG
jgi:pimeloyl-ACP methyl ester carboxylesterase